MNIVDKFVIYFYEKNYTFDKKAEENFRNQMNFAKENYKKTDEFLEKYYNTWCNNPDAFVLPYGVYRTLFNDVWPDLGIKWIQKKKLERKNK